MHGQYISFGGRDGNGMGLDGTCLTTHFKGGFGSGFLEVEEVMDFWTHIRVGSRQAWVFVALPRSALECNFCIYY